MSDNYQINYLSKIKGVGLVDNSGLVDQIDILGENYVSGDFKGSYLIPVELRDLAAFFRVKRWKFSVSYDSSKTANPDLSGSYTVTTPTTVYELYEAERDSPSGSFDTSASSQVCPDERYVELDQAANPARSLPFRGVRVIENVSLSYGSELSVSPYYGIDGLYYFNDENQYVSPSDGASIKPNDPVYIPIDARFGAGDDIGEVQFSASTNILAFQFDASRADTNKIQNAFTLRYTGVDKQSDMYWFGDGDTQLNSLSVDMEAAEYWSYGGKFNTTTGEPI